MRRLFVLLLLVFPAAALQAQRIQIDLPPSLAAKAAETVDVTLDGAMLRLAAKFLGNDGDERAARDMIEKLASLEGHFGIPHLRHDSTKEKNDD